MKYTLLFAVFLVALGCVSSKKLTSPRTMKLSFGGGFTGEYTTYIVDESGDVKRSQGIVSEYSPIGKLKKSTTKQLFSYYDNAKLDSLEMRSYGNMNYSITMKQDSSDHKIIWERNQEGSRNIQKFYDVYVKLIEMELLETKTKSQ